MNKRFKCQLVYKIIWIVIFPHFQETLTKPLITSGCGKVPQAVRQRYLDTFVTEAQKFCDTTKMAYDVVSVFLDFL